MPEKTQEDAKALMAELVPEVKKGGGRIANARITEVAVSIGLDGKDLDAALILAGEQGWIDDGGSGWTIITPSGYQAGCSS
jgi:hypothetical protein